MNQTEEDRSQVETNTVQNTAQGERAGTPARNLAGHAGQGKHSAGAGFHRLAICQWCLKDQSPDGVMRAGNLGYDGVAMDFGLWHPAYDLRREGMLAKYVNALAESGLRVPSLAFNALPFGSPEEEKKAVKILDRGIRAAAILGADILMIPCFGASDLNNAEVYPRMTAFLQQACDAAARAGMTVAAENRLTAAKNRQLVEDVKDNCRLYYDTANPSMMKFGDGEKMLAELLPWICEIHVKDYRHVFRKDRSVPLGQGDGRALEQMLQLRQKGFAGWVVSENSLPEKQQRKDAEILREIVNG